MASDRLTGLDASFLHMEDGSSHMHVASVLLFDGGPPELDELIDGLEARLHLVPRYRQKIAEVPLGQGRPKWVDDPHFNLHYHVRATALPAPGGEPELRALAGRVFAQPLDRDKPLWELWLVENVEGGRFAVLSKTHHALIDGIAGVDLLTVLFDAQPEPQTPPDRGTRWLPAPPPSRSQLLAEALIERATVPTEIVRSVRAVFRAPRRVAGEVATRAGAVGSLALAGLRPAPPSPYNTTIGPHRRYAWTRADLDEVKQIKNALGGTVNDTVLNIVTGALRRHLRRRGHPIDGLELRAMVPVSIRGDEARGDTGNQVAAVMAPLPVWCGDPEQRQGIVHDAMQEIKSSGQALGAKVLTDLTGFAPPTIMSQAARLMGRQRAFNVVVTNVPGPQMPLYLLGREMSDFFPMVPLARDQALGIAIMSYNGRLFFGLLGDYDAMPDLDLLAEDFVASLKEICRAAGVRSRSAQRQRRNGSGPRGARVGTRTRA